MPSMFSTRYTPTCEPTADDSTTSNLLVRIYPVNGLEQPVELGAAPLIIGRDSQCSLVLNDDSVSRRHATLEFCQGEYWLTDLGSRNGSYINERRISGREALRAGDRVRFGNQIFKYLTGDAIESQYHEVMFKLMTTDGLTSVYNKRYFLESLERELLQSQRAKTPLAVMMMDLDKFKSVNDTYGHLAGDAVLVEFARRANSQLRSGELFARYGGEEFSLFAARASLAEALPIAERIRGIAAATPVKFEEHSIPISVSIGLHICEGKYPNSPQELLAQADSLLYLAKRSGRNQVQFRQGAL